MSNLPNLPSSNDEFWDGDKNSIELNPYKCQVHHLQHKRGSNTMTCLECGYGFNFLPHQLKIEDKKVYLGDHLIGDNLTILS